MDCNKYNLLISAFIDRELDPETDLDVVEHISKCEVCGQTFEELTAILSNVEVGYANDAPKPNSQALWCRISNTIETEIIPNEKAIEDKIKTGVFERIRGFNLSLSPFQLVSSAVGIALISSLLTFVAIKNFANPEEIHSDTVMQPSIADSVLSKIGLTETPRQKYLRKIEEQKQSIAYWEKRVEIRKVQWDAHLQDAFDRNLREINKAVAGYKKNLEKNPNDKISNEMLDSALSEKMNFLREFAEL